MPRISSANPDFPQDEVPSQKPNYIHGLDKRQTFIPMAFQITSPFNSRVVLLPHALVMHVNPQNYSENHTKKVERIQTRGGFVEQHWGDELTEITGDGSTGAFMNINTGLTSVLRQRTIAWDRYRDLHDLYHNNGSLYDPFGNIVLQGNVMLMYDRGTYLGYFQTFEVEEADDQPFSFRISWSFKVQEEIMKIPNLIQDPAQRGKINFGRAPNFQGQKTLQGVPTTNTAATVESIQSATFDQRLSAVTTQASSNPDAQTASATTINQALKARQQGNYTDAFTLLNNASKIISTTAPPPNRTK